MVLALCKLHNFCINRRVPVFQSLATDDAYISYASSGINTGGVFQVDNDPSAPTNGTSATTTSTTEHNVEGLIHGGEHYDDVNRNVRRQEGRRTRRQMREMNIAYTCPHKNVCCSLLWTRGYNVPHQKTGRNSVALVPLVHWFHLCQWPWNC